MTDGAANDLARVLGAFSLFRTPAKVRDALSDRTALDASLSELEADVEHDIYVRASLLRDAGIGVITVDDDRFPSGLKHRGRAIAPALFYRGNLDLLKSRCISVSGSRDVSERGSAAATRLGEIAAAGSCLVAGNARGVDTITASAALTAGGSAILVLPEGITHFRPKSAFRSLLTPTNHLVVSQFPPDQRWAAHNAMVRNRVICGLASSVVVVEARDSGGSLAAGREAIKLGRLLITLSFENQTPPGNQILIGEGAVAANTPEELQELLSRTDDRPEQTTLL
ncbi:DNA-processing protein DprA [Gordonia hongkongensis]|uniref:DNA-processing protein DprA n=1 Tax=Gordonia hongkongensis TaxID=1701090 RepID=UPI003EBA31B7